MLGELSGEDETDRGLDLAGRDGRLLVVRGELGGFTGDALKDVVDKGAKVDDRASARESNARHTAEGRKTS